jgi:hypothetical protein
MKITLKTVLLLSILLLPVGSVDAGDEKGTARKPEHASMVAALNVGPPAGQDDQLDKRKSDFFRFAQAKIREMNRNHVLSRERMQVSKQPDGSYQAKFHQIDDTSMAVEISRSSSKTIPYVAVLTYREEIYAAACPTPAQCRQQQFSPVGYIPNRHIFSYSNGAWK